MMKDQEDILHHHRSLDQPTLFQLLKRFTVPILKLLPIQTQTQSIRLIPNLDAIQSIITHLLDSQARELLSPPMIHYVFFPIEQLYTPINLEVISDSTLSQLIQLSILLVRASKFHPPNPLWSSKEIFILNSILPILLEPSHPPTLGQHSRYKPNRSDETASLAFELMAAILRHHDPDPKPGQCLDSVDDLYQTPRSLEPPSPHLVRFLFQHLADLLENLHGLLTHPKRSQPSLDRTKKTVQALRLSLLRLSSSELPGRKGLDLITTCLPSLTSKLTRLVCILSQRLQFSGVLSSIISTIEWLLVECLDDQLPDIQEILALDDLQSTHDQEIDSTTLTSQSQVFDQVLRIASDWKHGRSPSVSQPSGSLSNSPSFEKSPQNQDFPVKRDKAWLLMTSRKVSVVLQRISSSLDHHPNVATRESWALMCCRLLDRSGAVLRIASSSIHQTDNNSDLPLKDGFSVLIETLISIRSDPSRSLSCDQISSSLIKATTSAPVASVRLLVEFLRVNFVSLLHLLTKELSGQDQQIICLVMKIISCLKLIIELIGHHSRPSELFEACLKFVPIEEFRKLLMLILCRVQLTIPKAINLQPDHNAPFGTFSITDRGGDRSMNNSSTPEGLPNTFPNLSVKHVLDARCVEAFEELIRTISQVVLHSGHLTTSLSFTHKISEINYFDHILQLSTPKGQDVPDLHESCLQLNALWALGQSIRATKSISRDPQHRSRFRKIQIFSVQGLKKMLDMIESVRITGTNDQEACSKTSSELMVINQALDSLPVTKYLKGNDRLPELERLQPVPLSQSSDKLIQASNFEDLRICFILRFVASLAYVFEGEFQTNLSWVLYFVLAQFGSSNPFVNQHAMATVGELALYCGYASIANMLEDNSDYLTHSISRQLLPHQYDIQAPFVLEHLIRLIGLRNMFPLIEPLILQECFELLDDYHGYDLVCEQLINLFRCVVHLISKEIEFEQVKRSQISGHTQEALDDQTVESKRAPIQQGEIDEIFEIEDRLAKARRALAGPPTDVSTDLEKFMTLQATRKEWIELQKSPPKGKMKAEGCENPRKPFGELDEQLDSGLLSSKNESMDDLTATSGSSSPLTSYQKLTVELITKSINFLTHSSSNVRSNVNRLIQDGVYILGSSTSNPQESSILPLIQRFWIIILNRLDLDEDDRSRIETLKLFQHLCRHLGSFMGRRLTNDIWPRLKRLLMADERERTNGLMRTNRGMKKDRCKARVRSSPQVQEAALETLVSILESSQSGGVEWKENLIWEIIVRLMSSRANHRSIDRILDLIAHRLGFPDSVKVAERAREGRILGMEFMMITSSSLKPSLTIPTTGTTL